jgi:hypothetical protein
MQCNTFIEYTLLILRSWLIKFNIQIKDRLNKDNRN